MTIETILTLVSVGLGLLASVFTVKWLWAKNKLKQFKDVLKEGYDVVAVSIASVDDDNITPAEVAQIKQEAAEFKAAVKLLFAKEEPTA